MLDLNRKRKQKKTGIERKMKGECIEAVYRIEQNEKKRKKSRFKWMAKSQNVPLAFN